MPRLSIIIVNWNGESFLNSCLWSLGNQSYRNFEVIFVDNASMDNSVAVAREVSDRLGLHVKFIVFSENRGFTGGNIEGLKHCTGDLIALLNIDICADKKWLEELLRAMEDHPEVGICTSKLIVHGTDVIDSAGDGYSTSLKGFKRGEGEKRGLFNEQEYIFGACAGAALYRRKMVEEIGFFDEDFFLIHEDTDINFRAQLSGWKVLYVPTALVYHKVRSSIGPMSDMAIYYTLRNSEFVRMKNVPLGVCIRCLPEFLIGALTEFIYFAIKHKRLRLYFKSKIDALRMFPRMLKKRTIVMKNKKISNRYLLNIMTPVWQKDFLITKIKKFLYT